ncbi:MAG: CBS domain-containing protein [Pseudohongiellaceae bacterium]
MKVREVMSTRPEYISADASIREAARYMKEMNAGFAPVAQDDKLVGVVTDRDLTVRALADGKSPDDKVSSVETPKVLYCLEDDEIEKVLDNMEDQHVQRLIVLNNADNKDFVGVVTLSDIADHSSDDPRVTQRIVDCCRHYH